MKNLFTLLLIGSMVMSASIVQAQDNDDDTKRRRNYRSTRQDFRIDLGMNNYLSDGAFPDQNDEPYTVRPFGSWYVALGTGYKTRLTRSLFLEWGADVSWYNFKFEDASVMVFKQGGQVDFVRSTDSEITPVKSKLTASYLNAQFVPVIQMGGRKGFRIGAGVYGGYRLGAHSKFVYTRDGQKLKDKDKDNFFLENLRYGIRARVGFRDVDLFANYDLNNLFIEGRGGPQVNAVSVGISLIDFD